MANVGEALQSAAKTFYGTYLAASDNKRREERDAEDDRWRRATMALQERQETRLARNDAEALKVTERNLQLLDGQIEAMEQEQADIAEAIEKFGYRPGMLELMNEQQRHEWASESHELMKQQAQVNMAATRAASAYRAAMQPFEIDAAKKAAERENFRYEMEKEEYEQFKSTKGLREAEGLVNTIQKRVDSTNELLSGYMDDFGVLSPDTPPELLQQRKDLTEMLNSAVTGKFTPEMYKSLGIDPEQVKAKAASSEAETEAMRIQRMYGAGGAAAREAEARAKKEEERAKKVYSLFYVDEQGKLQGTNDNSVIADLEKRAPDRVLNIDYVHGYMVGQPYSPRAKTPVRKSLLGAKRYALEEVENYGVGSPFAVGP